MSPIVHVACKLPHGLNLQAAVIQGTAFNRGEGSKGPELVGGYRITLNVPSDAWDRWLRANTTSPMMKNNLIFADANLAALRKKAKSLGFTRSGLEPR